MPNSTEDLMNIYDISHFNIDDLDVLLHETLKHARELLNAQAGTIYIKENEKLKFHVFQNDAMSYENIYRLYTSLNDLYLPLESNSKYLSVKTFIAKKIIMIDDVYQLNDSDFSGTKEFDKKFNYKSQSFLCVPLINPIKNEIIGVIQLINKKLDNKILPFDLKDKEIISMLSSFMALSISKAKNDTTKLQKINDNLIKEKKNLENIIKNEIKNNQKKSVEIFHKTKMNSMEDMLSNIAHQWRQPLSTISTIASGLSIELELDKISKDAAMSQLRKIVITTQNLSNTIDDFKSLYNNNSIYEDFFIYKAMKKVISLSEITLNINKIEVLDEIDKDLILNGFKNEFMQALVNLISNIKENFLRNTNFDGDKFIFLESYKEDNFIYLEIKDNSLTSVKAFEEIKKVDIFNISLYMAQLIIQKYFNGKIEHEVVDFRYRRRTYKGRLYTLCFPI